MKFKNVLFVACAALTWSTSSIAQVPGNVPTNGLVGWWPFNGNANDESENGNDGLVNGANLTADRFGAMNSAYSFGGSTDGNQIITGDCSSFPAGNSPRSISFWFTGPTVSSNYQQILGYGGASCGQSFMMNFNNPDLPVTPAGKYEVQGHCLAFRSYADSPQNTDQWNQIVVTYDGVNLRLYNNGTLVATSNPVVLDIVTQSKIFCFGMQPNPYGSGPYSSDGVPGFLGSLDDIGIWNRALDDAEIQSLYNQCMVLPTSIVGSLEPFALEPAQYNCNNNPGSTYEWSTSNGVITDGQGTSNVTVTWGSEGPGSLTVIETNADGCSGNAATLDVNVVCATSATAISGPLGPNILTETTYSCDGSTSSAYQWSITNGVITSGQGTNAITVLWGATGLGSVSVQETTSANCMGDVITLNVVAIPTSIEHLSQTAFEAYHQSNLESIVIRSSQSGIGLTYSLFDRIGKQVATGKISNTITNVETNMLTPGVYVLRIGDIYEQSLLIIRE